MSEPVAYVNSMCNDDIDWKIDPMTIDGQPLYTHSVKELTDEEIEEVWIKAMQDEPKVNAGKPPILKHQPFVFFAKAILKKAQEK